MGWALPDSTIAEILKLAGDAVPQEWDPPAVPTLGLMGVSRGRLQVVTRPGSDGLSSRTSPEERIERQRLQANKEI